MHLSDLKHLPVTELVDMAIENEIENASRMRKQDLILRSFCEIINKILINLHLNYTLFYQKQQ